MDNFEKWLCREMPAGTVIGNPSWWAPRIMKAAQAEAFYNEAIQTGRDQMQKELAEMEPVWFPLLGTGLALRWNMLNEVQAKRNHGQSLRRLAERGGLDPQEASAVINYRDWEARQHRNLKDALQALLIPQPTMPKKGE